MYEAATAVNTSAAATDEITNPMYEVPTDVTDTFEPNGEVLEPDRTSIRMQSVRRDNPLQTSENQIETSPTP